MSDVTHLDSLRVRLSNERDRLFSATNTKEIALRTVWVQQLEKEISKELEFLGIKETPTELSDDDLLKELQS